MRTIRKAAATRTIPAAKVQALIIREVRYTINSLSRAVPARALAEAYSVSMRPSAELP